MNTIFAGNLARLRKEHGLTQEKLAAKLDVSYQAVSKWETGVSYPDIELMPEIAAVFGVSIDALLGYRAEKKVTTHYEGKYAEEVYYWGNRVWSGCYDLLKIMPPTKPLRLLDIGCGEGQAAVFFSKNGYQVSAFDIAESGIEKAKHLADISGVEVDFFRADLCNYQLENKFDIIFASGVLQYIPEKERKRIIDNLKEHTKSGGIHMFNVFVEKPFIETPPDWENQEYFWKTGELFSYYHDWKIERMEESIFECNSSGILHRHCMNVMIARKM